MSFVDPLTHVPARELHERDVAAHPIVQFQRWFAEAATAEIVQPEAMTLATCTPEGRPSARMVLLRGVDERGFVFFTNYTSRKAVELTANPYAALVLFWEPLERQVRIEGRVERTSAAESDIYYGSRPHGSQIGAWASPQSTVLTGREVLEERVAAALRQYGSTNPVPRPAFWGGFRVVPELIEFWQGRASRLHDRLRYRRQAEGWLLERLAP